MIDEIKAATAAAFGVTVEAINGQRRPAKVAAARQIAMFLAHRAGFTLQATGAAFRRDHATVIHACERVRAMIAAGDYRSGAIVALMERFPCAAFKRAKR